jgi:hypothetical protein
VKGGLNNEVKKPVGSGGPIEGSLSHCQTTREKKKENNNAQSAPSR